MDFTLDGMGARISGVWRRLTEAASGNVRFIPPEERWMMRGPLLPGNLTPPPAEDLDIEGVHLGLTVPFGLTPGEYEAALNRLVALNLDELDCPDYHINKAHGTMDELTSRYRVAAFAFKMMVDEQISNGCSQYTAPRQALNQLHGTGRMAGTVATFD